jgi:hypothetical protein
VLDLWQQLLKRGMGIPPSNWAVVGRRFLSIRHVKNMYQPTIDAKPLEANDLRVGWWSLRCERGLYAVVFKPTLFDGLVLFHASYRQRCDGPSNSHTRQSL